MTSENAASGPPWPIAGLPWPTITHDNGYAPRLDIKGLTPVWGVGPIDGPVLHVGSAEPQLRFRRLSQASAVPLAVFDLRWAQGNKGHALARSLRRIQSGPIEPGRHRLMVDVEAARLGITLADHVAVVRAVEAGERAETDAALMSCYPGKSLAEIKIMLARTPEQREAERAKWRDMRRIINSYENWEARHRRSNFISPQKLFQRNRSIATAYKDGATLAVIGAEHGLSFGRIRQILDGMGVDRRPKGGYFARQSTAA